MSLLQKTEYTICDIIDEFTPILNDAESLERFLEIIEDELYICEDRNGGTDSTVSDLYNLTIFIRNRLIPLRETGYFNTIEDNPKEMLERFIESNLSKRTCSHMLLQPNTRAIHKTIEILSERA